MTERWNKGLGYSSNRKFYRDIEKYGWDNFSHTIVKENLSYTDARKMELEIIKKYDLVNNGYNLTSSEITNFDYYNFKIINNTKYNYVNNNKYFTRIPNKFVQNNLLNEFGLNRIFLVVFILIDRHRSYEDSSWITIGDILKKCKYKTPSRKPKIFYEIVKSLLFLKENNFIETDFDFETINYNDCIEVKIISENFDATQYFTKLYGSSFDLIIMNDSNLNIESLLTVFLYINSYIGTRPKKEDGSEIMFNPETKPEAFWRSIESMAHELSMSKDTISQCIDYLTTSTNNREALLVKREVGSIQPDKNKPPKNVPNIYVLNKEGYQQEIEWALCKMLEIYGVENFDESKGGKRTAIG